MTQFVNNDVSSGNVIYASDHNTQGALIAAVVNGGIENENVSDSAAINGSKLAIGTVPASKLDSDATGQGYLEIGRTTLGTAGDSISVTSIPPKKYLRIVISAFDTGGTIDTLVRFNNDSGNNYARRLSTNGGADVTAGSTSSLVTFGNAAYPTFTIIEITNTLAKEKNAIIYSIAQNTAGAGNLPGRTMGVGKWANTAAQINRVDASNPGTGDFAIGSEIVVFGKD